MSLKSLLTLSILAGLLLAGCGSAPVASSATHVPPTLGVVEPTAIDTPVVLGNPTPVLPMETFAPTAVPAATSRGPDLEATDPVSVSLNSGGLQLIEFFRFT
jgi:hypothetical protein